MEHIKSSIKTYKVVDRVSDATIMCVLECISAKELSVKFAEIGYVSTMYMCAGGVPLIIDEKLAALLLHQGYLYHPDLHIGYRGRLEPYFYPNLELVPNIIQVHRACSLSLFDFKRRRKNEC